MNQWKLQAENTADAKRGKTCNGCRARENMQRVLSAGEHATGAKSKELHNGTAERGAKCGNRKRVPCSRKHVWYQARDSMCLSQAQKTRNRFSD